MGVGPGPRALDAPAKLNLWLDVLGRRPDGYHDLESLFVPLELGDDVRVEPAAAPGVALELEGPVAVPAGPDNLALRAARAWLEALGPPPPFPGLRVRLHKRVPVGGGLGGGSSDAAAVLRALQSLVPPGRRLPAPALHGVARGLGADVPFFLLGGAAVGRGRGDELTPVAAGPPLTVLLVPAPWGHETARVFRHVEGRRPPPDPDGLGRALRALARGDAAALRAAHWNALAWPAMRAYPAFTRFTADVERALGRAPCLTGSGSTLYDLPDPGEAEAALGRVARLSPGARITRTAASGAPVP